MTNTPDAAMTMIVATVDWWAAATRAAVVAGSLVIWFLTQKWIAAGAVPGAGIVDRVHLATARWHAWFAASPRAANVALTTSSLCIDVIGLALIGVSIFGASFAPFLAVLLVFVARQISQTLCGLPSPPGMIWRDPGMPTLLVTYKVSNDFFFSGHTALAVLGATEAVRLGPAWLAAIAIIMACAEAVIVLILRAHWTLDVITGAIAALLASDIAHRLAPAIDGWLTH